MNHCPQCNDPLTDFSESNPGICRRCIVLEVMGTGPPPLSLVPAAAEDDYEIMEELGRGGDGTVFRAIEKKVGRQVAIKLISSMRRSDQASEERFRAEAEAIASLDHPNIIPIYAFGEMDGRHFYTMKLLAGGSVAQHIEKYSDPRNATSLIIKVSKAVHHAHSRGVLHRDIKPSNILLNDDGEPFLSDFGLSKRTTENTQLTISGAMIGTPSYMSPEQARGDSSQISTASDIFSIGTILYELLTKELLFSGKNPQAILRQVINGEAHFPSESKAPRDLQIICRKCLEKDPKKRYSSALLLAKDLKRWQRNEPIEARSVSELERLLLLIKRRPRSSALAILSLVAMVLGSLAMTYLWKKAVNDRNQADLLTKAALENSYFSTVANAMAARENWDFGTARRLLAEIPADQRNLEWRLVNHLSRGDQFWSTDFSPAIPLHLASISDHKKLLVLTDDRTLHTLDLLTGTPTELGKLQTPPDGNTSQPTDFEVSPDGRFYALSDGISLLIIEAQNHELKESFPVGLRAESTWLDRERLLFTDGQNRAFIYHLTTKKKEAIPGNDFSGPLGSSFGMKYTALARKNNQLHIHHTSEGFRTKAAFVLEHEGTIDQIVCDEEDLIAASWSAEKTKIVLFRPEWKSGYTTNTWPTPVKMALSPQTALGYLSMAGSEPWLLTLQSQIHKAQGEVFDDGHRGSTSFQVGGPFAPPSKLLTRRTSWGRSQFHFGHATYTNSLSYVLLEGTPSLISAGQDGTVRRWPVHGPGASLQASTIRRDYVSSKSNEDIPFASPSGDWLVYRSASSGYQEIWQRFTDRPFHIPSHKLCLSVSDKGEILCLNQRSNELQFYRLHSPQRHELLWSIPTQATDHHLIQSTVTPDEQFVATLHRDRITLVDLKSQKIETTKLEKTSSNFKARHSISISPNGQHIAITGMGDGSLRLYQRGRLSEGFRTISNATRTSLNHTVCSFSHDGEKLFLGDSRGWVRVFETESLDEITAEKWQAHGSGVSAICTTHAGDMIATAGGNQTILWSAQKAAQSPRRERLKLNTGSVSRNWLKFSKQDDILFHCAPDRPIEAWEAPAPNSQASLMFPKPFATHSQGKIITRYDFDQDLDSWTNLTQPKRSPTLIDQLQGWQKNVCSYVSKKSHTSEVIAYPGDQALLNPDDQKTSTRNQKHNQAIWARSPAFTLDQHSQIEFSLLGGSRGETAPTSDKDPTLSKASTTSGWIGIALRRASDGAFLTTAQRSYDGDRHWEDFHWNSANLAKLTEHDDPDEKYTLDLIDTRHGSWAWIGLDYVCITQYE